MKDWGRDLSPFRPRFPFVSRRAGACAVFRFGACLAAAHAVHLHIETRPDTVQTTTAWLFSYILHTLSKKLLPNSTTRRARGRRKVPRHVTPLGSFVITYLSTECRAPQARSLRDIFNRLCHDGRPHTNDQDHHHGLHQHDNHALQFGTCTQRAARRAIERSHSHSYGLRAVQPIVVVLLKLLVLPAAQWKRKSPSSSSHRRCRWGWCVVVGIVHRASSFLSSPPSAPHTRSAHAHAS